MKPLVWMVLLMLSVAGHLEAGEPSSVLLQGEQATLRFTGVPRVDFFGQSALWDKPIYADQATEDPQVVRKSPWVAAGLSALIPGAGEVYAQSYWKAAIFFAIEVAAITAAIVYNNKGDVKTSSYQSFADQHWSVVAYGQYTEDYVKPPNPPYAWLIPGTEGRPPWERVDWAELNRMERDVGGYYSHTLPPYGEQQYYELIGKYPQFNQGWDDAPPTFTYGDPLTPQFTYYSGERGQANTYYDNSSTAIVVMVVNHVLSALDGAWSAASYNSSLKARAQLQFIPVGSGQPQLPALQLSYTF